MSIKIFIQDTIRDTKKDIENILAAYKMGLSSDGYSSRLQFLFELIWFYVACWMLAALSFTYFGIFVWFLYFYMNLSIFQKRCRDIQIKGTLIILIVSAFFITAALTPPLNMDVKDCAPRSTPYLAGAYVAVLLFMMIVPGKLSKRDSEMANEQQKEPDEQRKPDKQRELNEQKESTKDDSTLDENMTCPLLKHPKIYFASCCLLYFIGKYLIGKMCIL